MANAVVIDIDGARYTDRSEDRMSEITEAELAELGNDHRTYDVGSPCAYCAESWPCPATRLIAAYREQATENARLRAALERLVADNTTRGLTSSRLSAARRDLR